MDGSKLNVKPTFGVSFGLPQGGGGSYPINPYGGDSFVNPYPGYGAGNQGLNLGLVSVNPLVALQVTKDDYGEKVIKPFVNLHVTPNQGIVNKLGHALAHKKEALFGGHNNYAPHYYPAGPPISHYPGPPASHYPGPHYPSYGPPGPIHFEKPHYHNHQHHHHQNPHHYQPQHYETYPGYYNREGSDYDEDYDYSNFGDYDNYYRNARTNTTSNDAPKRLQNSLTNQRNPNEQSSSKVNFPDRRKRDVQEVRF